jgi:outer membrane autotransporter protein
LANLHGFHLQRRTADIRDGSAGFSASGFHMAGSGPNYEGYLGAGGPSGPDGKDVKESKEVAPYNPRLGVFVTGEGEWQHVGNGDSNARGYDLDSGGFTLGIDYKVTDTFAIGFYGGYDHTHGDLTEGGRLSVDGGTWGLYSTFYPNNNFYADVSASGGYNSYSIKRAGLGGSTFGDTDGGQFNLLVGTGYMFHAGGLTAGPTATFQYNYLGLSDFTERGSVAPLHFPGQNQDSIRTAFGAKASYDWKAGSVVIRPEVSVSWQHEYGDTAYAIDSSFANGAGGVFTVHGPDIGRDSLLLGAGVAILWNERVSTYVYYDGEFGRSNYDNSNVSGGFRLSF